MIRGHPGLSGEFQDNQGYILKACLSEPSPTEADNGVDRDAVRSLELAQVMVVTAHPM